MSPYWKRVLVRPVLYPALIVLMLVAGIAGQVYAAKAVLDERSGADETCPKCVECACAIDGGTP